MTLTERLLSFRRGIRGGWRPAHMVCALSFVFLGAACAQETEVYDARLSPFPIVGGGRPAGLGEARATLDGRMLEIEGSYEGLVFQSGGRGGPSEPAASTASAARLHAGQLTGVRGEPFFDLTLTPASDDTAAGGTIAGSVELTAEQVEQLRAGHVYAQIYTDEAPEGHLWGWFLQ